MQISISTVHLWCLMSSRACANAAKIIWFWHFSHLFLRCIFFLLPMWKSDCQTPQGCQRWAAEQSHVLAVMPCTMMLQWHHCWDREISCKGCTSVCQSKVPSCRPVIALVPPVICNNCKGCLCFQPRSANIYYKLLAIFYQTEVVWRYLARVNQHLSSSAE